MLSNIVFCIDWPKITIPGHFESFAGECCVWMAQLGGGGRVFFFSEETGKTADIDLK